MADWGARFDRLVDEKMAAATAAKLFPYETILTSPSEDAEAIGNGWTQALFDGPFYVLPARQANRPACSLVFVQSRDGNTVAKNPGALGGGETDKHLIYEGLSRVAADAVMAGAETVRGGTVVFSVWHPQLVALRAALGLPRHPVQILATLRGLDIAGMLICNIPEIRVVLLTVEEAAAQMQEAVSTRPWIRVVSMKMADGIATAFAALRRMGIARISCVGGRTLASQLLARGLVDDVHLTTAPRPGGKPGTPMSDAPWRGPVVVRKHGSGEETGVVFEHVVTVEGATA